MQLIDMFVSRYSNFYNFALKLVRVAEAAEDVMQDTYIRLARVKILPDNPAGFILNAIKFTALNSKRGLKHSSTHVPIDSVAEELLSTNHDLNDVIFNEKLISKLKDSVSNLAPKQKAVMQSYLSGVGPAQYAADNGLNKNTTITNYVHGLNVLRLKLQDFKSEI